MKTKNFLLGMVALLLAVGSAFASLLVQPVSISVKYAGEENFTCVLVDFDCDEAGTTDCRVQVQLTPFAIANALAFDPETQTECSLVLKDASDNQGTYIDEREITDVIQ